MFKEGSQNSNYEEAMPEDIENLEDEKEVKKIIDSYPNEKIAKEVMDILKNPEMTSSFPWKPVFQEISDIAQKQGEVAAKKAAEAMTSDEVARALEWFIGWDAFPDIATSITRSLAYIESEKFQDLVTTFSECIILFRDMPEKVGDAAWIIEDAIKQKGLKGLKEIKKQLKDIQDEGREISDFFEEREKMEEAESENE